jgi:hypothetical protein
MSTDQHQREPLDIQDAFAELGQLTFDDTSMDAMLERIAQLAKQIIPGVAEASVSLVINDKAITAAYTGQLALELDELQYGRGYGPCLEAAIGRDLQEITDTRRETRWGDYTQECVKRGAMSSLSLPVPVRETIHGALNLCATEADAFDDDARAWRGSLRPTPPSRSTTCICTRRRGNWPATSTPPCRPGP